MAVSLVKRYAEHHEDPVSELSGVLCHTRLHLSSRCLAYTDIILKNDGTVWEGSTALPGETFDDGSRAVLRQDTFHDYSQLLGVRVESEGRSGYLKSVQVVK